MGEPNRSDVSTHLPANSTLARFNPEFTRTQLRSYERGLAAVVLGSSGLAREREHPCLSICHGRKTTRSESLFTVALARLERRGDAAVLLREALAKTRANHSSHCMGLAHLVPRVEGLLFPCSFFGGRRKILRGRAKEMTMFAAHACPEYCRADGAWHPV